jgi:hypothetical protein
MSHARTTRTRTTSKPKPERLAPPQATAPPQPGLLYTDREVATFLRLRNYRTLAVWRSRGTHPELKPVKSVVGSQQAVLYRGEDILAFVACQPAKKTRRRNATR